MEVRIGPAGGNPNLEPPFTVSDHEHPKGYYVYGHYTKGGDIFYVGKGIGRRAWAKDWRHYYWLRYVEKNLGGEYKVKILADGMSSEDARTVEHKFMEHIDPDKLINWVNWERTSDLEDVEGFARKSDLAKKNRELIDQSKKLEKTDLELAIQGYRKAITNIAEYRFIRIMRWTGLLGQVMREEREEREEIGHRGKFLAIDRLTLCLVKLGRDAEAAKEAAAYFKKYKGDLQLKASERVTRRAKKALIRSRKK